MQQREHLGRFRAAGIEFYLHKEFRAARMRFYRGTMRQKIAFFCREKQLLQGFKNLTIVWLKAFHIQMCVYVCVNVYNMCIVCVCVRMCERACACALCVCMCVYVCILF